MVRVSSLSLGHFTGNHRHTFGGTIPAKCIQSHRTKAASRDPLMPLFFCLGQHPALAAISAALQDGERLFAFLDDLYIVLGAVFVFCRPKAGDAYTQTWLLTAF